MQLYQYDRDTSCDVTAYHSLVALLCGERRVHFVVKVKLHDHVTRRSAILDPNHFDFDVSVIERQPHLFGYMSEFSYVVVCMYCHGRLVSSSS